MNTQRYESDTETLNRPIIALYSRINWRDLCYKSAIILAGCMFMFFIVLLKSKTTIDFQLEPYLFSYAIFVTTFILSRIIAAMFYENSTASLLAENASNEKKQGYYEPTLAFIIPCKNEEKNIANTIAQCYSIDYPLEKVEVIVINDGSTDGTLKAVQQVQKKYKSLAVIDWTKKQGKRQAMAAGIKQADTEIIIQLDSDSYMDGATIRNIIEPFENEKVGAVCASGQPINADHNIITRMQTAYYFMSFRILKAAESTYDTVFCCSGCCSAYRKSAVMPVLERWLCEKFLGLPVTWGDDRALTSWLLRTDKKTIFTNKAIAYTVVPDNLRTLLIQQLRWKKSWIVNFFFTSKFIFKKQPFVAFFYYFPLFFISILAPIMTFRALIFMPLTKGIMPLYHIAGVLLLTMIIVLYYRFLDKNNKFWPYLFLWSIFNLFVLSFIIVWAAIRIQDRGWGTR